MLSHYQAAKLVELGFVVVSANYRLCPTITVYEGPVSDAFDAYKWSQSKLPDLLSNDAGVSVDGSRIVTFGHSCGAALALLMVREEIREDKLWLLWCLRLHSSLCFGT